MVKPRKVGRRVALEVRARGREARGGLTMAVETITQAAGPVAAPPASADGAAARQARRDRRPPDRRGCRARRRRMAVLGRPRRGDRLRRGRQRRRPGPARSGHEAQPDARRGPARRRADFDDSGWAVLDSGGHDAAPRQRACQLQLVPDRRDAPREVGDLDPTGATVVFEIVVDDYAEVWVNGELPRVLGDDRRPGRERLQRAESGGHRAGRAAGRSGSRSPSSASTARSRPRRTTTSGCASATLDFYARDRAATGRASPSSSTLDAARRHRPAERTCSSSSPTGSSSPRGRSGCATARCCSARPNTNTIYRWSRARASRCSGPRAATRAPTSAEYHQPGSNGLTFGPDGLLTICQHGNRRVIRVEPARATTTVLADSLRGQAAEQPQRPRLPLRRHAVLHRSAVRAARTSSTTPPRSCRSAASSACATAR